MPSDHVEQDGVVQDLTIEHNGQTFSAVYFVEHGLVHVKIGDRLYRLPKGEMLPSESVRNLLLGLMGDTQRKLNQSTNWSEALPSGQD